MNATDRVIRHPGVVRFVHWAAALSGIALIFSGFGEMPMYKRYLVTSIPGLGWAGDYWIHLVIHYVSAFVFTAAVLFHVVFHWRREEYAALPKRGDAVESVHVVKAMLTGKKEPPHGKFLAEQRLAYVAMGAVSLVLIATGLVKTYKNTGPVILDPILMNAVTYAHTLATMLFLVLFIAHVAALLIPANWPLLKSMFTGAVSRAYARERHGKWEID